MPAAILVIDLVNDTLSHDTPLSRLVRNMIPNLNRFLHQARKAGHRVIFSTDSFLPGDFLFQGNMSPHSIRGEPGSEVLRDLEQTPEDTWLPKRRFSAFYKTDLDQTLRLWKVDTVAVAGVATNYCVLATAFDALCNDFRTVILEDMATTFNEEMHRATLDLYRKNPLYPLFRIMTGDEFLKAMAEELPD